jgi:diketogulonate reductase-like aldo/keto reductase
MRGAARRWIVQAGHVLTVLSESAAHQANDADLFQFSLTPEEMTALSGIQ